MWEGGRDYEPGETVVSTLAEAQAVVRESMSAATVRGTGWPVCVLGPDAAYICDYDEDTDEYTEHPVSPDDQVPAWLELFGFFPR